MKPKNNDNCVPHTMRSIKASVINASNPSSMAPSIALESFDRSEIPPYAILSHVWDKDEVTFQDVHDLPKAKRMLGYEKIRLSCRQAEQHSLEYIWVDTCCIDKSSSAELSGAINSMFKWYQEAKICYAYLNTTSTLEDSEDSVSVFSNSKWFTRGWTLQELIAPKSVNFYGKAWKSLSSRMTLRKEISQITRIPERLLQNPQTLNSYSVAKRMSWAGGRITTRLEDGAYSLLGVFGVHMPLLYGEGRRAFIRLQEEIIKISHDESLFVWQGAFLREEILDMLAPDPAAFLSSELGLSIGPLYIGNGKTMENLMKQQK
ncbi:heterokaryon incompatibility protein-domain-containing protein [Hyaloscypha sp. PMI_1271]|nr:heterokaryon incompatibility protein-domain-containing protein [Hyaloscypha sp. PMI_1271]